MHLSILWLFIFGLCSPWVLASEALLPQAWKGEALLPDEGLFYLETTLIDTEAHSKDAPLEIAIKGKNQRLSYRWKTDNWPPDLNPRNIWKLKADTYTLSELEFRDESGLVWNWRASAPPHYQVLSGSLAHFGVWYVVQLNQGRHLSVLTKPGKIIPAVELLRGKAKQLIEGASGKVLVSLDETGSASDPARQANPPLTNSSLMLDYRVDIFRQNSEGAPLLQGLRAHEWELKACYGRLLTQASQSHGRVSYTFIYSSVTHQMKSLRIKQSDLQNSEFQFCLSDALLRIKFKMDDSLIGELQLGFGESL